MSSGARNFNAEGCRQAALILGAAKAFTKYAPPDVPCELLLVEPFVMGALVARSERQREQLPGSLAPFLAGDGSRLRSHAAMNLPQGRCRQVFLAQPVPPPRDTVDSALGRFVVHTHPVTTNEHVKAARPG